MKTKTPHAANASQKKFMLEAIVLSRKSIASGCGPFGCVVVKKGKIIAKAHNRVTRDNDPTAHAEVLAIRKACKTLKSFQLTDCEIYTSCEPCPMCLGAIYWARPKKIFYANTKRDAAKIGFDDHFIYKELDKPLSKRKLPTEELLRHEAGKVFQAWANKTDKLTY
jgi:guanine deaminase